MTAGIDWGERLAVVALLHRYATGIDQRDWPLLRSCFVEACEVDYGTFGSWHSADEVMEYMERVHRPFSYTLHRITNPVPDVRADTATARSYVHAVLVPGRDPEHPIQAFGYYDDELVKTGCTWQIGTRRYTQARRLNTPPS